MDKTTSDRNKTYIFDDVTTKQSHDTTQYCDAKNTKTTIIKRTKSVSKSTVITMSTIKFLKRFPGKIGMITTT